MATTRLPCMGNDAARHEQQAECRTVLMPSAAVIRESQMRGFMRLARLVSLETVQRNRGPPLDPEEMVAVRRAIRQQEKV